MQKNPKQMAFLVNEEILLFCLHKHVGCSSFHFVKQPQPELAVFAVAENMDFCPQ